MQLANMPAHQILSEQFTRKDNEVFAINATLYETPPACGYWLVIYEAAHVQWGVMRFRLIIPKKIAKTVALAKILVGGIPLEQVKSSLNGASAKGRDLTFCPSTDGWILT